MATLHEDRTETKTVRRQAVTVSVEELLQSFGWHLFPGEELDTVEINEDGSALTLDFVREES